MIGPVYVDPFLGSGGTWLRLLGQDLVPPVAWMGSKRRLASELLRLLGLTPGRALPCILGDASWWGWVWPVCLDPVTGPEVSCWLRSWRGEDPRALWFRLRDLGPLQDPAEAAAQLLWLQARAASGVPVWWEGSLVQWASTKIDEAGQRQATELRLTNDRPPTGHAQQGGIVDPGTVADRLDRVRAACAKGTNAEGAGGIVDPGTVRLVKASGGEAGLGYEDGVRRGKGWRSFETSDVAGRLDAIRGRGLADIVIEHRDALDLVEEWAPQLGANARFYLDPPYQGATGYPVACPRDRVLRIAETCARHGGRVVLSEAVGLAAELGRGWEQVQLRHGRKPEWVTTWGCAVEARHGPLFAAVAR